MPPYSRVQFGSSQHDSLLICSLQLLTVVTVLTCSVTLRPQTMTLYQGDDVAYPDAGITSKNKTNMVVVLSADIWD